MGVGNSSIEMLTNSVRLNSERNSEILDYIKKGDFSSACTLAFAAKQEIEFVIKLLEMLEEPE